MSTAVGGRPPVLLLVQRCISLHLLHLLLSIPSCRLSPGSFQAPTGSWAPTAWTSATETTGKTTCHWSFSPTMQEPTAASPFPPPTLRQSHRTKSHRWVVPTPGNGRSIDVDASAGNPLFLLRQITSSFPSHPANSFFYPRLKHLPPMAKVALSRIKKTNQIISLPAEPTQSNQLPTGNEIEDKLISKSEQ